MLYPCFKYYKILNKKIIKANTMAVHFVNFVCKTNFQSYIFEYEI